MDRSHTSNLKGPKLAARLIGISTPVHGKDWESPPEERRKAGQVLLHLAKQQVLCDPYDIAIGSFVAQSILNMRERLNGEFAGLAANSVLQEGLHAMQAACRMFLDENRSPRSGYGPPYEAQLHSTLGMLRALVGIHIARIACAYGLEVDARLQGILPPGPD